MLRSVKISGNESEFIYSPCTRTAVFSFPNLAFVIAVKSCARQDFSSDGEGETSEGLE